MLSRISKMDIFSKAKIFANIMRYATHKILNPENKINKVNKKHITKVSFSKHQYFNKTEFLSSTCLLPISVGQLAHENEHLSVTLKLVEKSFKGCTIVLGDTLQRYTMGITHDQSEKALYEISKYKGDIWLDKHIKILAKLNIPWKVFRWDMYINDISFPTAFYKVFNLYQNEPSFKSEIDLNISQYLDRLKMQGKKLVVSLEYAHRLCLSYLLEECAVMLLWINEKNEFELYPNRAPAMRATYERFIQPEYPTLLRPISLRFRKVNVT